MRLGLDELGQLGRVMKARAAAERAEARARQAAERQRHESAEVFRKAVADVTPLAPTGRREPETRHHQPLARQRLLDERQALAQSLSDEIDIERLLECDEKLSGFSEVRWHDDDGTHVHTTDDPVAFLRGRLADPLVTMTNLEVEHNSLEDTYLELVRREEHR